MAIGDDFSIATNGDIRHTSGTTTYTVLELHRWLQDLADDQQASGNDVVDITSFTPSDRSTDQIITLIDHSANSGPTYNIDDDAAQYFYGGSVTQNGGDEVYSGLRVLGAVNNSATQLYVIQDNDLYQFTPDPDAPYWGDQSGGGYNGDSAAGILMEILVKSRTNGVDIDGKRIRVQARHWGDSYDFFNVTLGEGVSVAAIGTTPDAQNDTDHAVVYGYTHIVNSGGTATAPTGGYQTIDLNNGNGAQPYYSGWTYGADTSGDGLKGMWEYHKDLSGHGSVLVDAQDETSYDNSPTTEGSFTGGTGYSTSDSLTMSDGSTVTVDNQTGGVVDQFTVDATTSTGSLKPGDTLTATGGTGTGFTLILDDDNLRAKKTIDTLDGQLFLGITHSMAYDNESGNLTERETLVWGTEITYDTLLSGPFTPGNYVTIGTNGAAGRVMYDDGVSQLIVALDDTSITILDNDVITEFPGPGAGATTTTAAVNVTVVNNDKSGGSGILLALDDDGTTGNFYIQLLTGVAPVDNLEITGVTSTQTADVNGAPTARTVAKTFTGSYTGTLIGAYGLGVVSSDLTAQDTIEDLLGVTQTPPNNVTFSVTGLVSGEDRVLVAPRDGVVIDLDQLTLNTTLSGAAETSVVVTTTIPSDTPSPTGTIRVVNDSGFHRYLAYTSYTGSTFTITSADFSGADELDAATQPTDVYITYIDKLAAAATESVTVVFNATRDLFVRVRDGGATPIKTFESTSAQLTSTGGSVGVIRTSDA